MADMNRKAPTKLGITSGRTVTTDQTRRRGRSVLTVSHASGSAIARQLAVTVIISTTVRAIVWAVCDRSSSSHASVVAPALRSTRYARGRSIASATRTAGAWMISGAPDRDRLGPASGIVRGRLAASMRRCYARDTCRRYICALSLQRASNRPLKSTLLVCTYPRIKSSLNDPFAVPPLPPSPSRLFPRPRGKIEMGVPLSDLIPRRPSGTFRGQRAVREDGASRI